jgi:hypothetical protein
VGEAYVISSRQISRGLPICSASKNHPVTLTTKVKVLWRTHQHFSDSQAPLFSSTHSTNEFVTHNRVSGTLKAQDMKHIIHLEKNNDSQHW